MDHPEAAWPLCFPAWANRALRECPPILERECHCRDRDIVNDGVTDAIMKSEKKKLSPDYFENYFAYRAWVLIAAKRVIWKALGKGSDTPAGDSIADVVAGEEDVRDAVRTALLQRRVWELLGNLAPQDRLIIILSYGYHPSIDLVLTPDEEDRYLFEPFSPDQQYRIREIIAKRRPSSEARQNISDKDIGHILLDPGLTFSHTLGEEDFKAQELHQEALRLIGRRVVAPSTWHKGVLEIVEVRIVRGPRLLGPSAASCEVALTGPGAPARPTEDDWTHEKDGKVTIVLDPEVSLPQVQQMTLLCCYGRGGDCALEFALRADDEAHADRMQKKGEHWRGVAERHFVEAVVESKMLEDLDQLGDSPPE